MGAILDFGGTLSDETKIGFVDQCRALKSVIGALLPQVILSDATQLLINEGDKGLEGFLIPCSPFAEKGAYGLRMRFGHTYTVGKPKTCSRMQQKIVHGIDDVNQG